jgi:Protein of unknown function (DUF4231)
VAGETAVTTGEDQIESMLDFDRKILERRIAVDVAVRTRQLLLALWTITPLLAAVIFVGNVIFSSHDLWRENLISIIFAALLLVSTCITAAMSENEKLPKWSKQHIADQKLELELAEKRKRLYAAHTALPSESQRHIYRDDLPLDIERYRTGQRYYRRIHNLLQSLIIMGSLGTSTAAGLGSKLPDGQWIVVGLSFAVGIAAGFTGYFKFRERGFYLQQTADAIDEELNALALGIGKYKGKEDDDALADFADNIERLKSEQRKREQQLDQPSEETR